MPNGHVYAVRAPGDPRVKIGMTTRSPESRLRELNNTSVCEDFELEFALPVASPATVERAVHEALAARRVRDDREFFRCGPRRARAAIERAAAAATRDADVPGRGARRAAATLVGAASALVGYPMVVLLGAIVLLVPEAGGVDAVLALVSVNP